MPNAIKGSTAKSIAAPSKELLGPPPYILYGVTINSPLGSRGIVPL